MAWNHISQFVYMHTNINMSVSLVWYRDRFSRLDLFKFGIFQLSFVGLCWYFGSIPWQCKQHILKIEISQQRYCHLHLQSAHCLILGMHGSLHHFTHYFFLNTSGTFAGFLSTPHHWTLSGPLSPLTPQKEWLVECYYAKYSVFRSKGKKRNICVHLNEVSVTVLL